MTESNNHFARACELYGALHEVVLPGTVKPVLLRELPVFEFAAEGALPMSLAAKLGKEGTSAGAITEEDVKAYSDWVKRAVSLLFVKPRCAPPEMWGKILGTPGALPVEGDELLDPTLLPSEAQSFLIQFAKGEIDAAGQPVARFREAPRRTAIDRTNG